LHPELQELVAANGTRLRPRLWGWEYFVFENGELWSSPGHKLVEMASRELVQPGLARREEILEGK
jgi:hypothetical protein